MSIRKRVKLELYRKQSGFSQESVGAYVGVTRQTIASWESGETTPSLPQLKKIADLLRVPVELLLGQEVPEGNLGLLFRADDPTTLTPELRAILTRKAQDYTKLEELLGESPGLPVSRPLDEYDEFTVFETAEAIRDWLDAGETAALNDLFGLLENHGLKIIRYPLPEKVAGFSAYTEESGAIIVINENDVTERQLNTCTHELAHLIFHRRDYAVGQSVKARRGDPREAAANRLAGAVMLPDRVVRSELHAYKGRWIPEPILADIRKRYYVSLQTVVIRAAQVGIITDTQKGQQLGLLRRKYAVEEKPKLGPINNLGRLRRLVYTALLDAKITMSRASELLDIPLVEIRDELNRWIEKEQLAQ